MDRPNSRVEGREERVSEPEYKTIEVIKFEKPGESKLKKD